MRARHVLAEATLELGPEALVAPLFDAIVDRTLHVAAHARRRAHAREREAALGVRVDQFVPCRRHVGQDAEPTERIDALVDVEHVGGNVRRLTP